METALVLALYMLFSMIVSLVFFKTKIGQKIMEWMLDKLTLQ